LPSGSSPKGQALCDALVPALSRILRPALLAPDIIEAIGRGGGPVAHAGKAERPLPARWEEQRRRSS
jgi:hypothetical protein